MKKISKYINPFAVEEMRNAIFEANGHEVFFIGKTNNEKIIEEITVVARGNDFAVPVVRQRAHFGDIVVHNHPSGILTPSDNDLHISATLSDMGVASYIVNNEVDDIYAIVEPFDEEKIHYLDNKEIGDILKPDGAISKKLPGYEYRPQQLDMIEQICKAFNENKIAIIEAGTGIGKTLSYLLPAIYWAVKNEERCTISTHTINLQEQLINKDIPFLQSVLNIKFKAVLVKGRNNYVCLRKIADLEREPEFLLMPDEADEIKVLIEWSKITTDGSKSDLNFIPKDNIWEKIEAESDTCLRANCTYFKNCFVNKARREANSAHIIVANHYLLFADLAVRSKGIEVAVLPPYQRLVLDEAHHIEDVATHYFGGSITRAGISRMLRRLYRRKSDKKITGYLVLLKYKLRKIFNKTEDKRLLEIINDIDEKIIPAIDELVASSNESMDLIFDLVYSESNSEFGEIKKRVVPKLKEKSLWKIAVSDRCSDLIYTLKKFCVELAKTLRKLKKCDISYDDDLLSYLININAQRERLLTACGTIDQVLFTDDEKHIRWFEVKPRPSANIVRLMISPLDIAHLMKLNIYDKFNTVVMTSATLTVKGVNDWDDFEFFINRIGLNQTEKNRISKAILAAPFNFKEQAIVGIPYDIPAPDDSKFTNTLIDLIMRSIIISDGRAFILFTSYSLLNLIYSRLEGQLTSLGILTLKQGSANRHHLLQKFKEDKTSVLFATDSFWEGVDVQGEALESVIITRLPFKVPTEPVIEARVEAIKRRGGNAFMEYSLPQAVIKLKQGFGRLIRSKTDRGSILIFDKRIVEKFYGKVFVSSLPDCKIINGTQESVFNKLKTFYDNFRPKGG